MECVLAAAAAILHQLKANLGELLFIFEGVVSDFFTLGTLQLDEIVL